MNDRDILLRRLMAENLQCKGDSISEEPRLVLSVLRGSEGVKDEHKSMGCFAIFAPALKCRFFFFTMYNADIAADP